MKSRRTPGLLLCLILSLSLGLPAMPAFAGGKASLARAVAARVLSRETTRQQTLAANRAAGAAAEVRAAQILVSNGHTVLGSQVSVQTLRGRRVIDHLIRSPSGKITAAIEVKSGRAVRSAAQVAKDRAMATQGGVVVGKNAPPELRGKRLIIKTAERRPDR